MNDIAEQINSFDKIQKMKKKKKFTDEFNNISLL